MYSCFIAEGNWGAWGSWEACEADCGDSVQYRRRECNDPAPAHGGRLCDQTDQGESESRPCLDTGSAGTRSCTGGRQKIA